MPTERPIDPRLDEPSIPGFRAVPRTGVIFATTEAAKRGFSPRDPSWCNLGQGQPETGALPGAPPRITSIPVLEGDLEYGPIDGLPELRDAVAVFYNRLYRQGRASQYTRDNVCISGGGRASLTRALASLGSINVGHFLPDYTAYEELLDIFRSFSAIPILADGARGYSFELSDLEREVNGRGLSALLFSNPCNPTGRLVRGAELDSWVKMARASECTLLVDEFYSHYVWSTPRGELPLESVARHVDDVDRDPVVLFDGLTKSWRYPGFRVTWAVGPKSAIDVMASAGSFLDGGASRPMQRVALGLLDADAAVAEATAIQSHFRPKRERLLSGLERLGVRIDRLPEGTFYVWGDVGRLPGSLSDGLGFFRAGLDRKVITIPGEFFDINPGRRRGARASRYKSYVRFSFGPDLATIERALERMEAMVAAG
jgi:N-succinyldiaminopimelate aminotransferase